jgi:hypothetical protein
VAIERGRQLKWRTYTDSGPPIPTYDIFSSRHPIAFWTEGGLWAQSLMFETLKTVGIIGTAMILAYGSIAIFFIGPRCSFRLLKRAFIQIRVLAAGHSRNQNGRLVQTVHRKVFSAINLRFSPRNPGEYDPDRAG